MNRRDIVIGIVVVVLIFAAVYFFNKNQSQTEEMVVPDTLSVEDQIEDKFNIDIPEDVDRAELKDVSGGSSSALVTRSDEGEVTVLADLPDLSSGEYYEAWTVQGDQTVSLGTLRLAKGGYMLETEVSDTFENATVVVSREKQNDTQIEEKVLEGSF